jgi:hypothetical protein
VFDPDGGSERIYIEDNSDTKEHESAASMSNEKDDGGDILKEFLRTQDRDKFLPAKRTRKIRLETSVIKKPNEDKKKGKY